MVRCPRCRLALGGSSGVGVDMQLPSDVGKVASGARSRQQAGGQLCDHYYAKLTLQSLGQRRRNGVQPNCRATIVRPFHHGASRNTDVEIHSAARPRAHPLSNEQRHDRCPQCPPSVKRTFPAALPLRCPR